MMFYELSHLDNIALDDQQSRVEFHWGNLHTSWLVGIVILSGLVAFLWNRVKPLHVALLCILVNLTANY